MPPLSPPPPCIPGCDNCGSIHETPPLLTVRPALVYARVWLSKACQRKARFGWSFGASHQAHTTGRMAAMLAIKLRYATGTLYGRVPAPRDAHRCPPCPLVCGGHGPSLVPPYPGRRSDDSRGLLIDLSVPGQFSLFLYFPLYFLRLIGTPVCSGTFVLLHSILALISLFLRHPPLSPHLVFVRTRRHDRPILCVAYQSSSPFLSALVSLLSGQRGLVPEYIDRLRANSRGTSCPLPTNPFPPSLLLPFRPSLLPPPPSACAMPAPFSSLCRGCCHDESLSGLLNLSPPTLWPLPSRVASSRDTS